MKVLDVHAHIDMTDNSKHVNNFQEKQNQWEFMQGSS
jgi:hypothetical protein